MQIHEHIKYISGSEIEHRTGKSSVTIWRWCKAGQFPKPRKIGPNSNGWIEAEFNDWAADPEGWRAKNGVQ